MSNHQGSEKKAFNKLEELQPHELQSRAEKLSEAAIGHRLTRGQRTHRRRVTQVLHGMPSQDRVSKKGTPFISPTRGATEMDRDRKQREYDDAYALGNRDYDGSGNRNPYDSVRDQYRWQGYEDGYAGRVKRRIMRYS